MKLSLVIASGVHAGKVIPVTGTDFLIGRDPQCQLRPASPAVSKQHCGISIREDKVFVRDCGSTNGTFVQGEQIAAERQVNHGELIKVGPLEFTVQIEEGSHSKSSPGIARPAAKTAPATAKPAATTASAVKAKEPVRAATTVVDTPAASASAESDAAEAADVAAAMLLGEDAGDSGSGTVEAISADATTVMEMPALAGGTKPEAAKKDDKKANTASADAAAELLSKYLRRPRT